MNLPTDISKTSKPMTWNQPPKKTVTPDCSSSMQFVKPSHGDLPLQRIRRSTFDPHAVEYQGDIDKERVDRLIVHVQESMPSTSLQYIGCDGSKHRD